MAEIRWFGHNCVRIRGREATIICDPVGKPTGYQLQRQTADIVTLSHHHDGHANLAAIKGPHRIVDGPGEYEISEVFIHGIRTYHDTVKGAERGYNTIYLIELEGIVICHLGDLGHPLTTDDTEAMATCDVLLVPAGGPPLISPQQAAEIIGQLEPKIVIPLQYATPHGDRHLGTLDQFVSAVGIDVPDAIEKLVLKSSDLGETTRMVVLSPESEASRK